MSNGFWLSLDGILAIIIIVSVLLSLPILTEKDFTELVVLQKQHDLLKVWHIQKTVDIAEMQEDIEWLFPNQGFVLTVNDITIQKKLPYQFQASTIQTTHWLSTNQKTVIELTVYY